MKSRRPSSSKASTKEDDRYLTSPDPAAAGSSTRTSTQGDAVTPHSIAAVGDRFGRYRILKEIGRGVMGAVYLAEDTRLGRNVALKMPHFCRTLHQPRDLRYDPRPFPLCPSNPRLVDLKGLGQREVWDVVGVKPDVGSSSR